MLCRFVMPPLLGVCVCLFLVFISLSQSAMVWEKNRGFDGDARKFALSSSIYGVLYFASLL